MGKIKLRTPLYIVVPPKVTQKEIDLHSIDIDALARTEQEAWDKFTYPALNEKAYRREGYKALKVNLFIKKVK